MIDAWAHVTRGSRVVAWDSAAVGGGLSASPDSEQ
jgi:hypothetical protein